MTNFPPRSIGWFQGPSGDTVRSLNSGIKRPYLERIGLAHEYASAALLDLITHKVDCLSI